MLIMDNSNNPEKTNITAAQEQPQVQQPETEADQEFELKPDPQAKRDLSKITVRGKTIKVSTMIKWAIILLIYLFITNPGIIPFLPKEAKETITSAWKDIFGDVEKISSSFTFKWATLFQIVAIILMMVFVTSVFRFIVQHINPKTNKGKSALSLLNSAISYITAFVGFFWCLSAFGINLTAILASVGIVALIIGFGAQSLVEDLVTGLFLVFEDQFNVGDIIEVGGFRGVVDSIGIRTTAIRDMGGNIKIINNSDLRNILNRSTALSFATTVVSVSYSTNLEEAEPKIKEFIPTLKTKYPELFVEEPTYLGVQELGDSGVLLKFGGRVHEKDIYKAPRIMNREIKIFFDKNGIEIPFPQVVVHNSDK